MKRRKFLGLSLAALGAQVLFPSFSSAQGRPRTGKKKRDKVTAADGQAFVLNAKTNVAHFMHPKIYKFKHKVLAKNMRAIPIANWRSEMQKVPSQIVGNKKGGTNNIAAHFDKRKSDVVFENLALKNLAGGFTGSSLAKAQATISLAFAAPYVAHNRTSWRLFDLLYKVIVYNDSIIDKWGAYQGTVKNVDFTGIAIPGTNSWVNDEALFNSKINKQLRKKDSNMAKIAKRIII
ncbi:hypothetical protein [Parasediminibacterium sp. JCM 36343]|uniref:hypothetical protein n=1 Tax=Parasediminibacterium sp. JCM 36343 TaxID=3374279 RepID=UPI00397941CD